MRNQRTHILPRLVLAGLALLVMLLLSAPSALASGGCPNEQVRQESNINPTTSQPYDMGLPECRAYEMVSPLEKQAHDAQSGSKGGPLVSPSGDAIGYSSDGAFNGPENTRVVGLRPRDTYIAKRAAAAWSTQPALVPASVITESGVEGFTGDASLDLETLVTCGAVGQSTSGGMSPTAACAMRDAEGTWSRTPDYTVFDGAAELPHFWGASKDSTAAVWQMPALLPGDTTNAGMIFETLGLGSGAPQLRLVSVSNEGTPLGIGSIGPLFGATSYVTNEEGSVFQAISSDGQTVFFQAEPGVPPALYARTGDFAGGTATAPTTVEVASEATFVGASEDGSKVFFVTGHNLTPSDEDSSPDLYEYDFDAPAGQRYIDISSGGLGDPSPGSGADVIAGQFEHGSVSGSVVAISPDGSHVYFFAHTDLTTLPNGAGEHAGPGGGVFCYDTETGETKFVAPSAENTGAQTTPDGRYLIFTAGPVPPENTNAGRAVYRYDFQTGEVTWVSHATHGFPMLDEGDNATLPPREEAHGRTGAMAYYADARRAVSENGEYVIFETKEKLQADDVNGANDVYLWHNGTVSLISDGANPAGVTEPPSMSATGSDIVFPTTSQLVGQDTDNLADIYDARLNGGFPAPRPEPSCSGEACQGGPSTLPTFSAPGTVSFTGGGNQTAPPFKEVLEREAKRKSKPLTNAQKLARALKLCRRDRVKARRVACEKASRKRFGPKPKAKRRK